MGGEGGGGGWEQRHKSVMDDARLRHQRELELGRIAVRETVLKLSLLSSLGFVFTAKWVH